MSEMSMSAYAAHAGVDRKTVTRWVKEGKYIVMAGKKIDVESSDANLRKYRDRTDPRVRNAKSKKAEEPAIGGDGFESAEAIYDGLVSGRTAIRPIEESRAIKEHFLAELTRLEHMQKEGQLLELEVAEGVLFDCFRAQRDSWLNWPSRVAPLMAADLGIPADRMTEVLAEYVHKHITSLGEPEFSIEET